MTKKKILLGNLEELLGVPNNIVNTAKKLYTGFMNGLEKTSAVTTNMTANNNHDIKIPVKGPFDISDFNFSEAEININVSTSKFINKINIDGLSYNYKIRPVTPDYKRASANYIASYLTQTINLFIEIPKNTPTTWKDIYDFLLKKQNLLVEKFSHELKHAYDRYKKDVEPISKTVMYGSYTQQLTGLSFIDNVIYYMYYTNAIEASVRPSEMAAALENNNVSKQEFKQFFLNSKVFKHLDEARKFDYDKLKQDIVNSPEKMNLIDDYYQHNQIDASKASDKKKVEYMFKICFLILKDSQEEGFNKLISRGQQNPIQQLIAAFAGVNQAALDDAKEKAFNNFMKIINKFGDNEYNQYFKYQQELMNQNAEKTIRKLGKLYAYIDTYYKK